MAQLSPKAAQLDELMGAFSDLDERAEDIRGRRAYVSMAESGFSANIEGYTILADNPLLALRVNEIGIGYSLQASRHAETKRRLASPRYVPVLAIKALTLIAKDLH